MKLSEQYAFTTPSPDEDKDIWVVPLEIAAQIETANADLLEALEYIYDNADREDVVVAATERIIRKHKGEGK